MRYLWIYLQFEGPARDTSKQPPLLTSRWPSLLAESSRWAKNLADGPEGLQLY